MGIETLFTIMLLLLVLIAWYANTSKRNKILCRFRRVNKTLIAKWVKMSGRYVIFDGGKYDIRPSRIVFQWYNSGLVHMLFPQYVATLDYSWNSRFPHDPNDLKINSETPATRKALNKEEWVESYYKGAKPSQEKRQTMFQQYLPYIAIILIVAVAFVGYNWISGVNYRMADIANTLNTIIK